MAREAQFCLVSSLVLRVSLVPKALLRAKIRDRGNEVVSSRLICPFFERKTFDERIDRTYSLLVYKLTTRGGKMDHN